VFKPFSGATIADFVQTEAIYRYVLFDALHLRRAQNESPVLLSIFPGLSRETHELLCQMFFERFNVAGFTTVDRPLTQLYAANALNGVVVDIDWDHTDIMPIYDGFVVHSARFSTPIGVKHCTAYLAHLLKQNQSVQTLLPSDPPPDLEALATQIWTTYLVKVPSSGETALLPEDEGVTDIASILVAGKEKAVIESGMKKRASAKASAAEQARAREIEALDLVTVNFGVGEKLASLTIGKERHRFCEPLFDPELLAPLPGMEVFRQDESRPMSLQDAVGFAVGRTEVDHRQYIWGGLFVTGELSNYVKGETSSTFFRSLNSYRQGIPTALQSRLAPYILSSTDYYQHNEVQTRGIRPITVPDYFAEYRDQGDGLAAFLGSSIVAKVCILIDSQPYATK
jgi:actin-related protein 9